MLHKIVSLKQKYTIYLSAIIEVSFDSEQIKNIWRQTEECIGLILEIIEREFQSRAWF